MGSWDEEYIFLLEPNLPKIELKNHNILKLGEITAQFPSFVDEVSGLPKVIAGDPQIWAWNQGFYADYAPKSLRLHSSLPVA